MHANTPVETDVLVIGSGAAGLSAAIRAAHAGLKVLVAEKADCFGGTTAISGGLTWIPCSHLAEQAGIADSKAAATEYLRHTVGNRLREDMVDAYLTRAPAMLKFLADNSEVQFRVIPPMPDTADVPGSAPGRCVDPMPYDARRLGKGLSALRPPRKEITLFGGMMVNLADIGHLVRARTSWASFVYSVGLVARFAIDRLVHGRATRLVGGNALAARLLKSAQDLGVTLWAKTAARQLVQQNGRVVGALVDRDGRRVEIAARHGVILAAGGFPRNADRTSKLIPFPEQHVSLAPPENTGDGLDLGIAAGGDIARDNAGSAFLTPVSVMKTAAGETLSFPHLASDRAKPGAIAVGPDARRFGNEAESYHDFVVAMQRGGAGVPAWLICDQAFLDAYGLGLVRPAPFPRKRFIKAGYLIKAGTVRELAGKVGLDAAVLEATVERYNADARNGDDSEFGKGSTAYNRFMGDAAHQPNPCLAPLAKAPFYAVRLQTGDIGTSLGLRANPKAQALDKDDRPIAGLYVCGNDMNSIMAGIYPTGGITIGPALTFGYIAASDIIERARAAG